VRGHREARVSPNLSEKRQLDYVNIIQPFSNRWPSLWLQYGAKYPEFGILTTEVLLNNKGLTFEMLTAQTLNIKVGNKNTVAFGDSVNKVRAGLANIYYAGPAYREGIDEYHARISRLNSILSRFEDKLAVVEFVSNQKKEPITASQISNALSEEHVLIDFLHFYQCVFTEKGRVWKKTRYLAVVFQFNKNSQLIDLGEADQFTKALSN
jgi:hypothetical protein